MLRLTTLLFFTVLVIVSGGALDNQNGLTSRTEPTSATKTTFTPSTKPPTTSTTTTSNTPTTNSTTTSASTTPNNTNTTTESTSPNTESTTPSETTTSTTINPNITTSTSTTTEKSTTAPTTPKTTTSPAPVTTPAPITPLPPPTVGKWSYGEKNKTCIIVQFAAQMEITYESNNKTIQKKLNVPRSNETTVSGTCGANNQSITISWKSVQDMNNSFTLEFTSADKSEVYSFVGINVTLDVSELPNINASGSVNLVHKHKEYPTKKDNSYRCVQDRKLMFEKNNLTSGFIWTNNVQLQAFVTTNTTTFSLAKDCPFDTPDYVPITVGCALAGLVIIVLVAYLVGRRRNQAQGYLSM